MLKSILSQKKKVALHVSVLGEVIKGFIGLRDTLKVLNNDMGDEFIQYFEDTCTETPSTQPYSKNMLTRTDDKLPPINTTSKADTGVSS